MNKPLSVFTLILTIFFCSTFQACAQDSSFHPPRTAPEKHLDKILKMDAEKKLGDLFFNGDSGAPYNAARVKEYSYLFTHSLQESWSDAEKGDQHIDMDVIICGDFFAPPLKNSFYRTLKSDAKTAFIEKSASKGGSDAPPTIYGMAKEGRSWKLDSIDCGDTYKYNVH